MRGGNGGYTRENEKWKGIGYNTIELPINGEEVGEKCKRALSYNRRGVGRPGFSVHMGLQPEASGSVELKSQVRGRTVGGLLVVWAERCVWREGVFYLIRCVLGGRKREIPKRVV